MRVIYCIIVESMTEVLVSTTHVNVLARVCHRLQELVGDSQLLRKQCNALVPFPREAYVLCGPTSQASLIQCQPAPVVGSDRTVMTTHHRVQPQQCCGAPPCGLLLM